MKSIFSFSTALILLTTIFSCEKSKHELDNGVFKGTFTVTYEDESRSGETTLTLDVDKYTCPGNPDRIPAGGSGTFTYDESTVTFNDQNIWTADFDWNLILHGTYNYSYKGNHLIIEADKNDVGYYEYDLEKE